MTLSVIEIELEEGEAFPVEFYRDPEIEVIIRVNKQKQRRVEMVRHNTFHHYVVYTNPHTFVREIRRGWYWTVQEWYRDRHDVWTWFLPNSDETYTLEQLQDHQLTI